MAHIEDEATDEEFFTDIRRNRKAIKEDILDETFKKAEISKGLRPQEVKKAIKKPFLKLGIVLIIIAIISLVAINHLPWLYLKYDTDYGTIQELYDRDFKNGNYYPEIDNIFESPCTNCSNNSKNFMGLTKNDFSTIPKTATSGFYILALIGIIFTITEIIRKIRDFPGGLTSIIHSSFAAAAAVVGIFLAILLIKFLGFLFMLYYNRSFIEAASVDNIVAVCFAPIALMLIAFATIIISITVVKINFSEYEKKLELEKQYSDYSSYKYGEG